MCRSILTARSVTRILFVAVALFCQDGLCQDSLCQDSLCQDSLCQDSLCQDSLCQDSHDTPHSPTFAHPRAHEIHATLSGITRSANAFFDSSEVKMMLLKRLISDRRATDGSRTVDAVEIGPGKSFKLVADGDRIWVLAPRSRPDGNQDLLLYEVDSASLRPLSTSTVNPRPGGVRVSGEGLLLQSPDRRALYAVWNEPDSRHQYANRLMLSVFDKDKRRWKEPAIVNDDHAATTHSFQGAGVGPDGIIHVAWIDRRHNPVTGSDGYPGGGDRSRAIEPSGSLYYTRSLDGGRTFEKNRYVTGLVCACCQIAVAFSKGNVVLAWRSVEPGDVRDIFTTLSSDSGATWIKPRLVSRDNWILDGCPHAAPSTVSTPTGLYVAWMTAVSGKPEIYMVVSRDGGSTFEERLHVSGGVSGAKNPRLVAIRDRVGIVFEGRIEGRERFGSSVVYRELDRTGLSKPTAFQVDAGSASDPEISADHVGLLIGWSRLSNGSPTIQMRREPLRLQTKKERL